MALQAGEKAPEFTALSHKTSRELKLSEFQGQKVVLFFYPKDDTPGCTKENCEFRDLGPKFEEKNVAVFGVSADDLETHKNFATKYNLTMPLLADPAHEISSAYGVWGEQKMGGKTFTGIARTTFLIDEEGKIEKVYENVNPEGHAEEVLRDVSG